MKAMSRKSSTEDGSPFLHNELPQHKESANGLCGHKFDLMSRKEGKGYEKFRTIEKLDLNSVYPVCTAAPLLLL